jgi:hypothetical protein
MVSRAQITLCFWIPVLLLLGACGSDSPGNVSDLHARVEQLEKSARVLEVVLGNRISELERSNREVVATLDALGVRNIEGLEFELTALRQSIMDLEAGMKNSR